MKLLVFSCLVAAAFAAAPPSFLTTRRNPGFASFGAPAQKPLFPQRASAVPARAPARVLASASRASVAPASVPRPNAVPASVPRATAVPVSQPKIQNIVVSPNGDVQILRYDNDNIGTGNYRYGVDQSDGTKFEAQGELNNEGREDQYVAVRGSFEWIGADGVKYTATYVADENGYRPQYEQGPGGSIPHEIITRLLAK